MGNPAIRGGRVIAAVACATIVLILVLSVAPTPSLQAARTQLREMVVSRLFQERLAIHRFQHNEQDSLSQINLALRSYFHEYRAFPPVVTNGPDGRPFHSWRLLLLPYLDYDGLYRHYRKDEPWDSPHNATLWDKAPKMFTFTDAAGRQTAFAGMRLKLGVSDGKVKEAEYFVVAVLKGRQVNFFEPADCEWSEASAGALPRLTVPADEDLVSQETPP